MPKAYIQCLVFDKDFNDITPDDAHAMVTSAAAGHASSAEAISKELEITEDGYIYLYVANETKDAQVHFDDITVKIIGFEVSEMTDYYPFGSVATQWRKPQEKDYRFGYQGQFAEEDEETGFNHFEARDYDAVIGRWMNPDPARQYYSPYAAMGNNPISGIDPDGRVGGDINDAFSDAAALSSQVNFTLAVSNIANSGGVGDNLNIVSMFASSMGGLGASISSGLSTDFFQRGTSFGSSKLWINRTTSSFTSANVGKWAQTLGKYGKGLSNFGTIASFASVGINYQMYRTDEMSGARFGYGAITTGIGLGLGYTLGAEVAVPVSLAFYMFEKGYDHVYVPAKKQVEDIHLKTNIKIRHGYWPQSGFSVPEKYIYQTHQYNMGND